MSNDSDNFELNKIANILALEYVRKLEDSEPALKAQHLSLCGFSNTEIADLLGMTTNALNVALHRARKPGKKKAKKKKSKRGKK